MVLATAARTVQVTTRDARQSISYSQRLKLSINPVFATHRHWHDGTRQRTTDLHVIHYDREKSDAGSAARPPLARGRLVAPAGRHEVARTAVPRPRGDGHDVRRAIDTFVTRVARAHHRIESPTRSPVTRQHASSSETERVLAAAPLRRFDPEPSAGLSRAVDQLDGVPSGPGVPLDLDRLTDQVVTRIDDRLTAQRERFGWSS